MRDILGLHIAFTKPSRKKLGRIIDMYSFEILTMVLSALYWKKYHGNIKLYCDEDFLDRVKSLNLTWIWDEIDNKTLNQVMDFDINYDLFWSYPKIMINALQTQPFANLDLDLFISEKHNFGYKDVYYTHKELVDNFHIGNEDFGYVTYPDFHQMDIFKDRMNKMGKLNIPNWSVNVSFLLYNKIDVCKHLADISYIFANGNDFKPTGQYTNSSLTIFTEQRILAGLLDTYNYTHEPIVKVPYSPPSFSFLIPEGFDTKGITHLWANKVMYRDKDYEQKRIEFTYELEWLFKKDFPQEYDYYVYNKNDYYIL